MRLLSYVPHVMKNISFFLIISFIFSQVAFAGFRVPRSIYKMDQIEAAKAEAKRTGKPLVIVYSNPKTNCGKCVVTSKVALKALKSSGVLVFADTRKDSKALPSGVYSVLNKTGRRIPMAFVLTSDGKKGIDGVSYETLRDHASRTARRVNAVSSAVASR